MAAALTGFAIWQGERALRARIRAERLRIEQFRVDQESRRPLAGRARQAGVEGVAVPAACLRKPKCWYAVALPAGIDRVDVAGGMLPGWSALLTMTAAHQLAAGGEVTVLTFPAGPSRPTVAASRRAAAALSPPSGCCPLTWRGLT